MNNLWETIGINYLMFKWDQEGDGILDSNDVVMKQVYPFIEACISNSESLLVHSITGMNRSVMIVSAYLMIKYHWSLKKSLEFIKTRKPNLEIRSNILEQLVHYEVYLHKKVIKNPTKEWYGEEYESGKLQDKLDTVENLKNEEFMLRNTYLNSLAINSNHNEGNKESVKKRLKKLSVKWLDKGKNIKTQLEVHNEDEDLINKQNVYPVTAHVGINSEDLVPAIRTKIEQMNGSHKRKELLINAPEVPIFGIFILTK
jgi:hypothetical protein